MNNNFQINFIGIGAAKSGTSWLAKCLAEHPQINFSNTKEVCFFNKKGGIYDKGENDNYQKGIKWYKKHFNLPKDGQITGEFSVDYLFDSEAASNINKIFPNIKLLVCLRKPWEMVYSHYWWYKLNFKKEQAASFEIAIKQNVEYLERALYANQLEKYYSLFSQNQIFILLHDEIISNPESVLRKTFSFLEVDKTFCPKSVRQKINTAAETKSNIVSKILTIPDWLRKNELDDVINVMRKIKIYRLLQTVYTKFNTKPLSYEPMQATTKKFLKYYYKQDIARLETITELNLNVWRNSNNHG